MAEGGWWRCAEEGAEAERAVTEEAATKKLKMIRKPKMTRKVKKKRTISDVEKMERMEKMADPEVVEKVAMGVGPKAERGEREEATRKKVKMIRKPKKMARKVKMERMEKMVDPGEVEKVAMEVPEVEVEAEVEMAAKIMSFTTVPGRSHPVSVAPDIEPEMVAAVLQGLRHGVVSAEVPVVVPGEVPEVVAAQVPANPDQQRKRHRPCVHDQGQAKRCRDVTKIVFM
ncbi:GL11962 [Drosophila persimilis]|uniref:GL11962 n=1 Tax=Drosophila persimilis TaxID=7234 RepID=B4GLW0_DROPE|nr:GL11962 [Drosophila persimilis]